MMQKCTFDHLAVAIDDELNALMIAAKHIRAVRVDRCQPTCDIEHDICYIERELQIRNTRASMHMTYRMLLNASDMSMN